MPKTSGNYHQPPCKHSSPGRCSLPESAWMPSKKRQPSQDFLGYYKHLCFPVFAPWDDKKGLQLTRAAAARNLKSFLTVYVSFRGDGERFESGPVLFNLSGCVENRQGLFSFPVSTYRLHSHVHKLRKT